MFETDQEDEVPKSSSLTTGVVLVMVAEVKGSGSVWPFQINDIRKEDSAVTITKT